MSRTSLKDCLADLQIDLSTFTPPIHELDRAKAELVEGIEASARHWDTEDIADRIARLEALALINERQNNS